MIVDGGGDPAKNDLNSNRCDSCELVDSFFIDRVRRRPFFFAIVSKTNYKGHSKWKSVCFLFNAVAVAVADAIAVSNMMISKSLFHIPPSEGTHYDFYFNF